MSENRQTIRRGLCCGFNLVLGVVVVVFTMAGALAQSGLMALPQKNTRLQAPVWKGGTVQLAWTPSSSLDVTGYRIYYGTNLNNYNHAATVGNVTNATIDQLERATTYYFAATSYTSNGVESVFSNVVTNYVQPKLEIVIHVFKVVAQVKANTTNVWQVSTNGTTWISVLTNTTGGLLTLLRTNNGGQELIRLKPNQ